MLLHIHCLDRAENGRPVPTLSRIRPSGAREGLTTEVNITVLVDFHQNVVGFSAAGVQITNGFLTG
jgi:hypothetical protein